MRNDDASSAKLLARVAGVSLLVIISSSLLSNDLVVSGNPAATTNNILSHEGQFRVGLAGELIMLNSDIVLAVALYALFRPVNEPLALLGAFWRVANAIVLGVGVAVSLVALRSLSFTQSLAASQAAQAQASGCRLLNVHGAATLIGLIFFGFGAATHGYLFWRSRYIPRWLSGSYVSVAVLIIICCFGIVVFPGFQVVDPWFIMPDFIVELMVALWLIFKGVNVVARPRPASSA